MNIKYLTEKHCNLCGPKGAIECSFSP